MASQKGILATAGILGAITAASFLVWAVPQANDASFVVSDFEGHLDGIKSIHATIREDLDAEFRRMLEGDIRPEQYIRAAQTSAMQINSQIIAIAESDPLGDWQDSYARYMESLRQSNSHIRETIVVANMVRDGAGEDELRDALDSADLLRSGVDAQIEASDGSRP